MESKELAAQQDQVSALDRLPFSLTQLVGMSMQRPRDPMMSLDNALHQLNAMPEFAEKAYYSIPFKTKSGGKEWIEGPSIKAATALSAAWGNNVEGGFLGQETTDYIDVFGYFFDYETGKMTIRPWRVSKTFRTDKGQVIPWRKDMLEKQIMAGVSKAIRNAILNGLPMAYVNKYFVASKALAARGGKPQSNINAEEDLKSIINTTQRTIQRLAEYGVTIGMINEFVQSNSDLNNEEAVAARLVGILNALDNGETTVVDVFAGNPEGPIAEPQRMSEKPVVTPVAPPVEKQSIAKNKADGFPARFDVKCLACGKKILKGERIYKNESGKYVHEATC